MSVCLNIPVSEIFDYVSYYDYCEGIKGFVMCILKRDVCAELRCGSVVQDIVIYDDGSMQLFQDDKVYTTYLTLSSGLVWVHSSFT